MAEKEFDYTKDWREELSDQFKKEAGIGKYPSPNEKVSFQIPEPATKVVNGEERPLYKNVRIPNKDTVYDPYQGENGTSVHIWYGFKPENNEFEMILFPKNNKSRVDITGRTPGQFELLDYLRACNYNQTNPLGQRPKNGFMFKELEPQIEARTKNEERKEKVQTENYIFELSATEAASYVKSIGMAPAGDEEINKDILYNHIQDKKQRKEFLQMSRDARQPVATLVDEALNKGVIEYIKKHETWRIKKTGKELLQVPPNSDSKEALLDYFHNDKHGQTMKNYVADEVHKLEAEKKSEASSKEAGVAENTPPEQN